MSRQLQKVKANRNLQPPFMRIQKFCSYRAIIVLLYILVTSCHLDKKDFAPYEAPSPQVPISGLVVYSNKFSGDTTSRPLQNQTVYIKEKGKPDEAFVATAQTDANGLYRIGSLKKGISYEAFVKPIISIRGESALYLGRSNVVIADSGVVANIYATLDINKQTGIHLITKDTLGGKLGKASVYIYTSRLVALNDTSSPSKYAFMRITDSLGHLLLLQLPSDSLFINASLNVNSNVVLRSIAKPILPQYLKVIEVEDTLRRY